MGCPEASGHLIRSPGNPWRDFPDALAMSPDGRTLYVGDLNAPAANGAVAALDLATGRLGRPVGVIGPAFGLVITPDGRTMFASDGDTITPVGVAAGTARRPVQTGIDPSNDGQLLMSRDGRTLYISGDTRIRRYDIAVGRFGTDIPADDPAAMLLSRDGKTLWYASGSGQVVAVDLSTGAVRARIPMGEYTPSLAMTPDGRTLYVAVGVSGPDSVAGPGN